MLTQYLDCYTPNRDYRPQYLVPINFNLLGPAVLEKIGSDILTDRHGQESGLIRVPLLPFEVRNPKNIYQCNFSVIYPCAMGGGTSSTKVY